MHDLLLTVHSHLDLFAADPTPAGTLPTGLDTKINTILFWVRWLCIAVVIAGIMAAGAAMAFGGRGGDGSQHVGRLGWAAAGGIVIGLAGAITTLLV